MLHVDHIVPVCAGGDNDVDNLTTACDACNLGKGGRGLKQIPKTVAEKAEILREKEEQIVAFNELLSAKAERLEKTAWIIANILMEGWEEDTILKVHFASIKKFCDELPLDDVQYAAELAIWKFGVRRWTRNRRDMCFRYFCGTCWRMIKGLHDEAA